MTAESLDANLVVLARGEVTLEMEIDGDGQPGRWLRICLVFPELGASSIAFSIGLEDGDARLWQRWAAMRRPAGSQGQEQE